MPEMFEDPKGSGGCTGCIAAPLVVLVTVAILTLITKGIIWGWSNYWGLDSLWQIYIAYAIVIIIGFGYFVWRQYQKEN